MSTGSGRDQYNPVAESVPFDNEDTDFVAEDVQAAIEESFQSGFPRAGIILVQNGTQGSGDWITYSNLTPDAKIVFPVNTRINEVTFANSNSDVEFSLVVYKNGTTGGDIVDTWTFDTGPGIDFGFLSDLSLDFSAGDWIRLLYQDDGTNTSDLVLTIWISRNP